MAHKVDVTNFMLFSIAVVCLLSCRLIEGTHAAVQKLNGAIKTIESEDGDVIDCVHIHKQPTYDHPLVKSIQLKPNSYPNGTKPNSSQSELTQIWHKTGKCPEGTVPIRRTPKRDYYRRGVPSSLSRTDLNQSLQQLGNPVHEYAVAQVINNDKFYGGHASINVWNPKTDMAIEFSLSQIWLVSDTQLGANTIEAGWMVYPHRYGDSQTRFFIFWTRDGYRTGCYDLDCPGFMQTNQEFAIGSAISGVSSYNGDPSDLAITIYMDKQSGNWWLQVQGITVGYWPGSLFVGFAEGASYLQFGGEIINSRSQGRHTTTQMGSGHFPSEGYRKSSYFRDIKFVDNANTLRNPQELTEYVVTNPLCYDLHMEDVSGSNLGINFYYGGLGYSANCP